MNCVCLCVKVQNFTFSGCRDKKILGHGHVWNGGRSSGQTSEPTKGERDWYPSFYLLRVRKKVWGLLSFIYLKECQKTVAREAEQEGDIRGERDRERERERQRNINMKLQ